MNQNYIYELVEEKYYLYSIPLYHKKYIANNKNVVELSIKAFF